MFNHDFELEKSNHPENFEPTPDDDLDEELIADEDDSDLNNYDQISQG